jgi:ferrous iron transport protein B
MRNTTMRGEIPPFIMELPTYHMPQFKSLMLHLWDKAKHFIQKAFTIILASSIVVWLLSHFSWSWTFLSDEALNQSILASIGQFLQPIFTPLGFGSQLGEWGWVFIVSAVVGLIAKENVVSTFGVLAACITGTLIDIESDGGDVQAVLTMINATGIGVGGLLSFIVFNMTTIPCFAATAAAKAELKQGTFKWTLLFWIVASFIASIMVYNVWEHPWTIALFIALITLIVVIIKFYNKNKIQIVKK